MIRSDCRKWNRNTNRDRAVLRRKSLGTLKKKNNNYFKIVESILSSWRKRKQQTFQSYTDWFKSQKNVVTSWQSFPGLSQSLLNFMEVLHWVWPCISLRLKWAPLKLSQMLFFFFLSFRVQGCRKINFSPSSVYGSVMNVFQTSCWKAYFETESL